MAVYESMAQQYKLHRHGVQIAAQWLLERGFELESVARSSRYDPQIIATRGGRRFHFAVRTARWPALPRLECAQLREELCAWATRHEAACYLLCVVLHDGATGRPWRVRVTRL